MYYGHTLIPGNADLDAIIAAAASGSGAAAAAAAALAAATAATAAAQAATLAAATNITSPEAYGAPVNGTSDDAAAIRSALAALAAIGGGTLSLNKSYFLNSYDPSVMSTDEYVAFFVPSNVTVTGGGTLKMSNALQSNIPSPSASRVSFIGLKSGTRAQHIHDLTFDCSAIVPTKAFCSFHAVLSAASHPVMENLYVPNCPGRQMFMTESDARHGGAAGAGASYNVFRNITIRNGSRNASAVQDDCCMVYLEGHHHLVEFCDFSNDIAAILNIDALDFHGSYNTVRKCRFTNMLASMYIGVQDGAHTVAVGNIVDGNLFQNNNGGIVFIDPCTDTKIINNTFDNCEGTSFYRTISGIINPADGVSQGPLIGLDISNNTFVNDPAGNSTIQLASLQGVTFTKNRFLSCNYPINILASTTETKNVLIAENLFLDPPNSAFLSGQVYLNGDTGGVWAGKFSDVVIRNNLFSKNRGGAAATNTSALVTSNSGGGTITAVGIRFFDNDVVNVTPVVTFFGGAFATAVAHDIPSTYTPTWSQVSGTQPALGNGTLVGTYVRDSNGLCTVRIRLVAGTTTTFGNAAVAYNFSLPVPTTSLYDLFAIPGAANVFDSSALLDFPCVAIAPLGSNVAELSNKGQLVRDANPIAWATGDTIDIIFSYPT